MGLFDFRKKKTNAVVPNEQDTVDKEKINWYFTEEAKEKFERSMRFHFDEMMELYQDSPSNLIFIIEDGTYRREDMPCTFFADYLREMKLFYNAVLVANLADLAHDGDVPGIPYPECIRQITNPLIDFAVKMTPLYKMKNGENLKYSVAVKALIFYIHRAYCEYVDVSDEIWMYEQDLFFTPKGKLKDDSAILEDIKTKARHKEYFENLKLY